MLIQTLKVSLVALIVLFSARSEDRKSKIENHLNPNRRFSILNLCVYPTRRYNLPSVNKLQHPPDTL